MNWLLTGILLTNLAILTVSIFLFLKALKFAIIAKDFIISPGENKPSPLAELWDSLCKILAAHLVTQVKTTLMGIASGQARQEKALQGEILEEVATNKAPLMAAALSALPGGFKKSIFKNQALMNVIMSKLLSASGDPPKNGQKSNYDPNKYGG